MDDIDERERYLVGLIREEQELYRLRIAPIEAELMRLVAARPAKPIFLDWAMAELMRSNGEHPLLATLKKEQGE